MIKCKKLADVYQTALIYLNCLFFFSGVRSCACDIRNLEPFRDYKFRIRVENKYGVSDPSPFAVTYR